MLSNRLVASIVPAGYSIARTCILTSGWAPMHLAGPHRKYALSLSGATYRSGSTLPRRAAWELGWLQQILGKGAGATQLHPRVAATWNWAR